jgi:hypothetical protein
VVAHFASPRGSFVQYVWSSFSEDPGLGLVALATVPRPFRGYGGGMAWGKRDPRKVQAFERGFGTDRVEAERWVALLQAQDAVVAELRAVNAALGEVVRLLGERDPR